MSAPNSLNPSVSFRENPEKFILEHCENKQGNLETNILEFLRRLTTVYKVKMPPLKLANFPSSLHTPSMKRAMEYFEKNKNKAA
ncbi:MULTISPECIES: hypothetical protein [Leptospira]|uniref:Uncharacterized protein n=1 Tax=Leptospira bouyouniensis TaxID=2484911 RepID=A0ABY2L0C1_9LEPT|nr:MULTISPECIES: hypothetical protein [Leptospira]TGK45548.1 hypothetical protein EHQ10_19055 [Leptospira bouyouniensis]TGL97911.1 hypothetical protein EHQ79_18875 [Leptospira jelokensis]TGM88263.1 hypothetical protein EHQ99_00160 [Leptospira bouyouniensis]